MWSGETRVLAAAERVEPVDVHHVGADALDRRAHAGEHAREVLHVRLGGGVADGRRARGERRGHERVLGAHHGRLVHEEVARAQPAVGRGQPDVAVELDHGAERAERVEVRDRGGGGRSRRRPGGGSSAEPKRASSGPPTSTEARMRSARSASTSVVRDGVGLQARPCCRRGARPSRRGRRAGPAAPRVSRICGTLWSTTGSVREQAGGKERQGRVLVPGGHDGAAQRHAAFDDELLHKGWERFGGADAGPPRKLG